MEATIDFLREKGLLSDDKSQFTIQKDTKEFDLIEILNEFADLKWKEKYLRLAADFDNYKKRSSNEKENIKINEKISNMNSILDLDNDMSLAFNMIKDKKSKESVNIFIQKMSKFLESQGIEEIQTEKYDPDLHEVIHLIEPGSEKITEVVSKGYKVNDKVIRFPKIILGK